MPKSTAVDRRARVQRRKVKSIASGPESAHPPTWIQPQLTRLVDEAPTGKEWLHEIKYDGYRMHARIDGAKIQLLTRTGLDLSHRCKRTIEALRSLKVKSAYFDRELCALNADGLPVFSRLQAAMDEARRISESEFDRPRQRALIRRSFRATRTSAPGCARCRGRARRSQRPQSR
jgi:ATP-dependent DNA ligase